MGIETMENQTFFEFVCLFDLDAMVCSFFDSCEKLKL
jgi:hypothetical protein